MTVMTSQTIESLVSNAIPDAAFVKAAFDGSKTHIVVVYEGFEGMRRVQKQQLINRALADYIADGRIHAVTMETLTPSEWEQVKHFR